MLCTVIYSFFEIRKNIISWCMFKKKKVFIPKEIVCYSFKKNQNFFILLVSFLQGWGIIKYKDIGVVWKTKNLVFFKTFSSW